ncbi:hypothetical protein GQ457_08G016520 [Hibiscus cannabinus]
MEAGRVGRYCNCGCLAELKTREKTKKCNLFEWFDAKIVDRLRILIVGLLRKRSAMENAKKHERIFWVICVIILLYLVFFW